MQRLEIGSVLSGGPGLVLVASFPVTPKRDVLESIVNPTVLQVRGGHNAATSRRIDEVVELDRAALTLGVGPLGSNGTGGSWITLKNKAVDLGLFNDLGTELSGVAKQHLVSLRTNLRRTEVSITFVSQISSSDLQHSKIRESSRGR